jgi:glycosyltransferase involved in cell wall biosynthesis
VSDYVGRSIATYLHDPHATVIRNTVDPSRAGAVSASERSAARARLGLAENALVVTSIGRLHPEKGQRVLLEAAAQLAPSRPELRILLVGDGPQRQELEALARTDSLRDRVALTGWLSDPRVALAASDVLVVPSLFEGFGLVLAEGMASGLACVASNVGALPELLEHERSGLLVEAADSHGLASALDRLLGSSDLRHQLGAAGLARVAVVLDLNTAVAALASRYRAIARP